MSKNSQEVVHEGWLTKSPPTKRIWRARWRRRWFSLRHSGELPGQFLLTYYTDRNCRKLKGVIDLDHCEQVDVGLRLEERKLKFDHVFDIKTPTRTYYLAADTEKEMRLWVKYICNVCNLKCTSDEEANAQLALNNSTSDIEIHEETEEKSDKNPIETNLTSNCPESPSPYIPISECFSGRSPVLEQDFNALLVQNLKNSQSLSSSLTRSQHANEMYEMAQRTYLNCDFGGQFYDLPRKLCPGRSRDEEDNDKDEKDSPLQSPTDSESVFTDDDWTHNTSAEFGTSRNTRPSDSSADIEVSVAQKFTKMTLDSSEAVTPPVAPPRPPKPAHISTPSYFGRGKENIDKNATGEKLITDDMYDIPRSHQFETESVRNTLGKRHNYNNAEPVHFDDNIFRYDNLPKPGTSSMMFRYDPDETKDEPASPLSQNSTHATYLNLNSPNSLLPETQTVLTSPPAVNRGLKPKRKLSDSLSIASVTEPSSPQSGPSIDRKLKPISSRKNPENCDESEQRKIRAAPSPIPLINSHECLLDSGEQEQIYHFLPGNKKMQYLDLDLELGSSTQFSPVESLPHSTVYKEVDFTKTLAFNITRNDLEKERNKEPGSSWALTFSKK